jgi:preprotein translocase subunit SecA
MHIRRYSNDFDKVLETHRKHIYSLRRQFLNMDRAGCDAYISKCVRSSVCEILTQSLEIAESGLTARCMLLMVDDFMSKHVDASESPKQW